MPDRQQAVPCASDGMDNCWIYPHQPQCVKYTCMSVYMYVYVHICNQGIETPLTEMDPDIQFYSDCHYIKNLNCDYYLQEKFQNEVKDCSPTGTHLSLVHLNIKSLPKHYDELVIFLESLGHDFSFIGLTETWLDEYKHDLYDLPDYNCIHRFREGRRGGGCHYV